MLTIALLVLFTLLCILLSADRAWDNETKAERNALVFDGRNRSYGAFALRREYERRFILAFAVALGVLGTAVVVPKMMAALGMYAPVIHHSPRVPWIDLVMEEDPRTIDKPKAMPEPDKTPRKATGGPVVPSNPDAPVVVVDSLPQADPEPGPAPRPDPLPGGGGAGPTPDGGGPDGDGSSSTFTLDAPGNPGIVDVVPEFPGGQAALARFIQDNLRITNDDIIRAKEQIVFVIDTDGSVVRVKARGRSVKEFCEAAERVVRGMPKWKPAKYNGKDVPCVMVLPIEYQTR